MDIAAWLRDLGLDRYVPAFDANDIDGAVLPTLTAGDLEQLGINSVGHRRKLLDAIAALRAAPTPMAATAAAPGNQGTRGASVVAAPGQAERRQITVLFCDLVGSTRLSTQLDPEDLSALLAAYRRCCTETVARWSGYVAKYMGDGLLAYFGWPQAHEDDAERAVRAGLALVTAIAQLPARDGQLAARVGIATGEVVVGDLIGEHAAREHNVVGETPNLAARLQALAQPDTIVIDPRTRRLLGNLFDFRNLGPVTVKGFADSVPAYQVVGVGATESRFEALHAHQTPLVGREEELDLLLRRWEQARQGEGQVVLLAGEPGIGKSRTSATLLERLANVPHVRLRYFCSPHHATSPLHPFVAQLERAAGFASEDPPAAKFAKLVATLAPANAAPTEDAALLAELLSIPPGEHYRPLALGPEQKKQRTLAALLGQLRGLAMASPVLMVVEDLHWVDPTSRELLERTVECVEQLPVLLVLTFRPEFQPPWLGQSHVSMHMLRKLNRRESVALIDRLTDGKALPAEVAEQVITHTDGVPLFMEELTRSVLEGGLLAEEADRYVLTGPLPPLAIPTSLQASLLARLDRLASLKDIAQIGSAIGREFPCELLAGVAGRDDEDLQRAIDQLVEAGLLFRRGTPPRASLMFKHALVQDAAYASLLRGRRQELHARIAGVLEEAFPEIVETQPELLAHHCAQAGLNERAVAYWQRAGERALARSANLEAIQHFGHGIELIEALPVTPHRNHLEFRLYLGLGPAVRAVKGHAAPETLHVFSRARELIAADTSLPDQMRILYGLWGVRFARGEHEAGRGVAEQALRLAAGTTETEPQALANRLLGETLFAMGEFVTARRYVARAIDFCNADSMAVTDLRFSFDHKAGALSFLGWILWPLGYPERAHAAAAEAIDISSRMNHAATTAMTLSGMTVLAEFRRDASDLRARADAQAAHCARNSIATFGGWGRFGQGLARFWNGDPPAGIETMHAAMMTSEKDHAGLFRPMHLGFLAEAHACIGGHARAFELLDEAIALAAKTKEGYFEAELHRLRGELLVAQDSAAAEASLEEALSIARRQSAKSWELRAAVSLARLWRDRGDSNRATELLAPVYNWFTEGFDTPDLQAARDLLASMRRSAEG